MTELFEGTISVQFVLNVLRQHEIELDRSIEKLEFLVEKVNDLTKKMEQIVEQ